MELMKIELIVEIEYLPKNFPACVEDALEKLGLKITKAEYKGKP